MIFTVHSIFWKSLHDMKKLCALIRTLCEFSLNKLGKNPLKLNGFSIFFSLLCLSPYLLKATKWKRWNEWIKLTGFSYNFFSCSHYHSQFHHLVFSSHFFGSFFMLSMGKSNQQRREKKSNEMSFVEARVVVEIERNIRLYPARNETLDGKVATTTVLH